MSEVRVRFAPSPTGLLHVGGLRTALYNYLFARNQGGKFILRIEDTDRTRFVEGAVENLIKTLKWGGLSYDEGPEIGGPFGPYIQSERTELYRDHANRLLEQSLAYRCFCTSERLEQMRKEMEKKKIPSKYDRRCLALSHQEVSENLSKAIPFTIRMKVPDDQTIEFQDIVREKVEIHTNQVDDQVLIKSDGYPTYHLANVVDDHFMQITHVIRGEEWLSSVPKHVILYQYFGWERPIFAHLPLLLNSDRSKLSKRQGDVAVEDYIAKGYFKEAMINFVALLGWNPGDEREIFSLEQLVKEFSLDRVNKAGAIFNVDKLNWLNQQHLRLKSDEEMLVVLKPLVEKEGFHPTDEYLKKIIVLMKERISFISDLVTLATYFFKDPESYDLAGLKKRWKNNTLEMLQLIITKLERLPDFDHLQIEQIYRQISEEEKLSTGDLIHPSRIAISGVTVGAGLFEMMEVLGKETVLRRMKRAVEVIPDLIK
jgi:glutamyl-tRNA synthetase